MWDQNAERRHLQTGTKAAIRLNIEDGDKEWQAERERMQAEANRKRREAAKEQHQVSNPRIGETVSGSGSQITATGRGGHPAGKARAKSAKVSFGTMAKPVDLLDVHPQNR